MGETSPEAALFCPGAARLLDEREQLLLGCVPLPPAWRQQGTSEAQLSAEVAAARRALEEARRQGGAQEGGGCAARAEARRLLEGVIRWSAKQKSQ